MECKNNFSELKECELCMEQISTKYSWFIRIGYSSGGGFYKRRICRDCVKKLTGIPEDRMKFEECIREYFIENHLSKYNTTPLDDMHIIAIKKRLEKRNIPIRNYGIPLYYLIRYIGMDTPRYLHDLLGKVE